MNELFGLAAILFAGIGIGIILFCFFVPSYRGMSTEREQLTVLKGIGFLIGAIACELLSH